MFASRLRSVDVFEPMSSGAGCIPVRLPGRVAPFPDEALASWLLRYSAPLGLSPERLLFGSGHARPHRTIRWWRRADPALVTTLSERSGISRIKVGATAFEGVAGAGRLDDLPGRFSRFGHRLLRKNDGHIVRVSVCRECLAGDSIPYIRRDWTLGWATVCPVHRVELVGRCPRCRTELNLPKPSDHEQFNPGLCRRCRFPLTHGESRQAHEAAIRLHRRLIQSHECGFFNLVGYGDMRWAAILGVSSALVSVVWDYTEIVARRRLFNDAARDLGLAARLPTAGDNYHGLLIVAWAMDDWPKRSRAIARGAGISVERLREVRIGGKYDAETRGTIEDVLASAWSARPLASRRRTNAGGRSYNDVQCDHGRGQNPLDAEYLSHAKALLRFFRRRGFGHHDARDLVQQVLLRLLEADRGQIVNMRGYAYRIAANEANGFERSRRITGRFQSAIAVLYGNTVEARDPPREIDGREAIRRLVEAILRLRPRARATWLAARVANRPQAAIAAEAGCGRYAIEKALRRADSRLRAELSEVLNFVYPQTSLAEPIGRFDGIDPRIPE
jgi:RNA polymerase sigma factor (sigma-70 family)